MLQKKLHQEGTSKFPPSVQSDLFQYLRPEQQEFLKPILRVLKKQSQEDLCVALIDYLETGIPDPPYEPQLYGLFRHIIHDQKPKGSAPENRKFLYPLSTYAGDLRSCQIEPKSIGTIIKQVFKK